MDLVVHEMAELEHVDDAHSDREVELLATASITQHDLPVRQDLRRVHDLQRSGV